MAIGVEYNRLTVEHDVGRKIGNGFGYLGEMPSEIRHVARPKPETAIGFAGDQPITVVLDLMRPARPRRSRD
jgi:hypothetical protein